MSVETVKARLAQIQSGIAGIKRAFVQGPNSLNVADMPLFMTMTGKAEYDWGGLGSDAGLERRLYLMRLYVMPFGAGVAGEAERAVEPFFQPVRDTFAARPSLGNLAGVQNATLVGDSGIIVLQYPQGTLYFGVEFRLMVEEYFGRSYVDYE